MRGTIQQRDDKSWRIRAYVGRDSTGSKRYASRTVHGTHRDAERELSRLRVEVDERRHVASLSMTLNEQLNRWLEVKRQHEQPSTWISYEWVSRKYVRLTGSDLHRAATRLFDVRAGFVGLACAQGGRGSTSGTGRESSPGDGTYLIRYGGGMSVTVLTEAREAAGLSKTDLAERAHTSRSTLSAYEHGRVSPTLETVERILTATGRRLVSIPVLRWEEAEVGRGRTASIPNCLPDLAPHDGLRTFTMPLHLDWSRPGPDVRLADRRERARAYEIVLREGTPADIESIGDGSLLVDLWDELVLPRSLRSAWQPLIDEVLDPDG